MTPHGLDAIGEVCRFLEQDILPGVVAELRGELRAAIKILHSAATELNVMSPMLRQECAELLALNEQSSAYVALPTTGLSSTALRAGLADVALDLRALFVLHEQVQRAASAYMMALLELSAAADGERCRELLLLYYQALERQAVRRLPWQSVFTRPPGADAA